MGSIYLSASAILIGKFYLMKNDEEKTLRCSEKGRKYLEIYVIEIGFRKKSFEALDSGIGIQDATK